MEKKTYFRTIAKEKRKQLDLERISRDVCTALRGCEYYTNAQNVMLFYPTKYEINTLMLLEDGKNFYFPKVSGADLLVCPNCGEFSLSSYNIYEPESAPEPAYVLDLVIVPALMIDRRGYRLGYGGGFYDRFLRQNPGLRTVGVVAQPLYVEMLPHENHDVRLDYVITG